MTGHITAAELRVLADHAWTMADERQALRRAAAALDAKDARIAELEGFRAESERQLQGWIARHTAAMDDAELGALVRRWRDHPERKGGSLSGYDITIPFLTARLRSADAIAASREAEQGVEGPSGWRYTVGRDGHQVIVTQWRGDVMYVVADESRVYPADIPPSDIPTVAALIERHGGGE